MAPPRAHHGGGGNHGGGSAVTRDRVIVVLFLGLMVALGFGLASLQGKRTEEMVLAARQAADADVKQAAAKAATAQQAVDEATANRRLLESERDSLKRELDEARTKLAATEREHAAAAKLAEEASSARQAVTAKTDQLTKQRDDVMVELREAKDAAEKLRLQMVDLKTRLGADPAAAAGAAGGVSADDGRHTPLKPSKERDALNPELAAFLRKVAVDGEVLAAMSNINYAQPGGMLDTWMEGVKRCGVKNAMVIALDAMTKANAEKFGVPAFEMHMQISKSQEATGDNHAVSSLKFRVLRHFLQLGYAVFLSDVDIVTLQNPFPYLVRDSDVEGMSDGFDNGTAYGYNDVLDDPTMGWARYAHSMRVFVFNSGLFYIRPTPASLELLDRLVARVESENGWDQAIFNEVIYFPSRPGYTDPHVKRRVLDYLLFMNSKVLFKTVRKDVGRFGKHLPVMIHVNYHPNKHERMLAIVDRYVKGNMKALDSFPDGSEY